MAGLQPPGRRRRRDRRTAGTASEAVSTVRTEQAVSQTGACRRTSGTTTLQFLDGSRWTRKSVDYFADDDLEADHTPAALAARYDLIVFPGHEEYVTTHACRPDRALPAASAATSSSSPRTTSSNRVVRSGATAHEDGPLARHRTPGSSVLSVSSTSIGSTNRSHFSPTSSPARRRRDGCSREPGGATATGSAATASRSTRERRSRLRAPESWPGFRTAFGPGKTAGDDLPHDTRRCEGVRRGSDGLHVPCAHLARRTDPEQPLEEARDMTRSTVTLRWLYSSSYWRRRPRSPPGRRPSSAGGAPRSSQPAAAVSDRLAGDAGPARGGGAHPRRDVERGTEVPGPARHRGGRLRRP